MSELYTLQAWPALERPVLVLGLEGWIDAGQAAGTAVAALHAAKAFEPVATFDADELIDHRARRPILRIVDGVDRDLRWPELRLEAATAPGERSLLLLAGPEPDMRWHRWTAEVVALAARLGVEQVVGLGAFPAPVPHTRAVRVIATSPDAELARSIGTLPATIDVPAGAQGALQWAFGQAGVPVLGLWARVPHYAAALPYPAGAAALLDELSRIGDVAIDTADLHETARGNAAQLDQLIAASPEHAAMVRQLEEQHDAEVDRRPELELGAIPSGDEIAAELERFLRGER